MGCDGGEWGCCLEEMKEKGCYVRRSRDDVVCFLFCGDVNEIDRIGLIGGIFLHSYCYYHSHHTLGSTLRI